jgi:hypothetical protein
MFRALPSLSQMSGALSVLLMRQSNAMMRPNDSRQPRPTAVDASSTAWQTWCGSVSSIAECWTSSITARLGRLSNNLATVSFSRPATSCSS